jgi:hypothetical protein
MVYNPARHAKLPFSNAVLRPSTGTVLGKGVGSVVIRVGGPGAGSSYNDIDEYIATTGINPYSRQTSTTSSSGSGLKKLSSKLEKLTISKEPSSRRKNITMTF